MAEADRYISYLSHFATHRQSRLTYLGGGRRVVMKAAAYIQEHDPCRAKEPDRKCDGEGLFGRDEGAGEAGTETVIDSCGLSKRSTPFYIYIGWRYPTTRLITRNASSLRINFFSRKQTVLGQSNPQSDPHPQLTGPTTREGAVNRTPQIDKARF